MKKLMLPEELSEYLGVTRTTLWKWQGKGMPYIRLGVKLVRYDLEEVMKWLSERSSPYERQVGIYTKSR